MSFAGYIGVGVCLEGTTETAPETFQPTNPDSRLSYTGETRIYYMHNKEI